MHIVVCMKQVPRDNSVKINPDLSINAEGIEQIMNLFDEYAVEEGLKWNEKLGGKVTILSLGPQEWQEQIESNRVVTEVAQHPPQTRGERPRILVVCDDLRIVADAKPREG